MHVLQTTSRCGLGQAAANPVLDGLRNFRPAYDAHGAQGISAGLQPRRGAGPRAPTRPRSATTPRPTDGAAIMSKTFLLDGRPSPLKNGQSVLTAREKPAITVRGLLVRALSAARKLDYASSRSAPDMSRPARRRRAKGWRRKAKSPRFSTRARELSAMLFAEGNHFCPSCEKSGNCLQALAYDRNCSRRSTIASFPMRR